MTAKEISDYVLERSKMTALTLLSVIEYNNTDPSYVSWAYAVRDIMDGCEPNLDVNRSYLDMAQDWQTYNGIDSNEDLRLVLSCILAGVAVYRQSSGSDDGCSDLGLVHSLLVNYNKNRVGSFGPYIRFLEANFGNFPDDGVNWNE